MTAERYVVIDLGLNYKGDKNTAFSRIRHSDHQIQFNKNYFGLLSKDEIEANVIWCETRIKDFEKSEIETDKYVYAICKSKGIEKALLSAMIKQGKLTLTPEFKKRVEQMSKLVKNK